MRLLSLLLHTSSLFCSTMQMLQITNGCSGWANQGSCRWKVDGHSLTLSKTLPAVPDQYSEMVAIIIERVSF